MTLDKYEYHWKYSKPSVQLIKQKLITESLQAQFLNVHLNEDK